MADEEHLAILKQGVYAWNAWRMKNPQIIPDLSGVCFDFRTNVYAEGVTEELGKEVNLADLFEINFSRTNLENSKFVEVDLTEADLSEAILDGADFSYSLLTSAVLTRASIQSATFLGTKLNKANINYAKLINAELSKAKLFKASICSSDLSGSIFEDTDLNEATLVRSKFNKSKLINATLINSNISESTFLEADFENAEMCRIQALGTDFTQAKFTGICIEDWNINRDTKLHNIDCSYVFLKSGKKDRFPKQGFFAVGEFSKRYQVAKDFVELTFYDTVPWKAFACAFNETNIKIYDEYDGELFLQEYRILEDGIVTIKIKHPPSANSDTVRDLLEQQTLEYERRIAHLQGQLQAKESTLSTMLERVFATPQTQSSFQIRGTDIYIGESISMSGDRIINMGDGNYIESNTGTYIQGDYLKMSQDLSQAASQIQDLIEQLARKGVTVDEAQSRVAQDIANQAKTNLPLKTKLLKWGQSLGDATVSDVVKGAVKLAIRSAGVPLP
jgi:uncharacterized protein YjbI with pentapeptide repeats